ncbi:MAG: fasciclin domain-containing protein, partial [Prolixibacteraceae bacterium]|nr:fasciclin domain-containing protein [Prolixibacteraceae bacterium]
NRLQGGGNQEIDNYAQIIGSEEGDNGVLYYLDKAILGPKNDAAMFIARDEDLTEFYNLLYQAGLSDTVIDDQTDLEYPQISFLQLEASWTVFAPTNDAIIAARNNGEIPEDIEELKNFLRYHFVFDNVIFNDGKLNGTFSTAKIDSSGVDETFYAQIDVLNSKNNLSVVDKAGTRVDIKNSTANNLVKYGVLHKIDKTLQSE